MRFSTTLDALTKQLGPTIYDGPALRTMTGFLSQKDGEPRTWSAFVSSEFVHLEQQRSRPLSLAVKQLLRSAPNPVFYILSTLHLRYYQVEPSRHAMLDALLADFPKVVPKMILFVNQCLEEDRYQLSPELIDEASTFVKDLMVMLDVNREPGWFTSN